VTAPDPLYCFRVERVTAVGTVWSLPPPIRSRGPRSLLSVSTWAGEWVWKLALAASNSGFPGAGMDHCSYSSSDSSRGIALPNP
jgi:hypothetical protein